MGVPTATTISSGPVRYVVMQNSNNEFNLWSAVVIGAWLLLWEIHGSRDEWASMLLDMTYTFIVRLKLLRGGAKC